MLDHPINNLCEFLSWDSEFFGLRIAKALIHRVDAPQMLSIQSWCTQQKIDCFYFLSDADDPLTTQLLEQHAYHLVDTRLTFERRLMGDLPPFDTMKAIIRDAHDGDIQSLKRIAQHSYQHTRYYFDGRFPIEQCNELYVTWIEKSYRGYADKDWVAELEGVVVGFITASLHNHQGDIGLVGVDSQHSGKGIGYQLVLFALAWLQQNKAQSVKVVTQGRNIPAQRLYQRVGFITHSLQHWYHYWRTQ